jgi:type II secretory pathway predicted ATPase ExeA
MADGDFGEPLIVHPYERQFGLTEVPFTVTPDPRYFYANPAYREAYAMLRYGVEARKGFILFAGEAGTGKTTLLRMLMEEADQNIKTAFIYNAPRDFTTLLKLIMAELELPESEDRTLMTAQLNEYLLERLRQGQIVALLIDEAQALSRNLLEDLRLLSNLETHKAKLIQTVLMGQPEIEQMLDQPELRQLKQRIALRCRLMPLAPQEIGRYIDFRLRVAGYKGADLFDKDSLPLIARCSHGIPRLINVLCDNALLRACAVSARNVSTDMVMQAARDLRLFQDSAGSNGQSTDASARLSPAVIPPIVEEHPGSRLEKPVADAISTMRFFDRMAASGMNVVVCAVLVFIFASAAILYIEKGGGILGPVTTDADSDRLPAWTAAAHSQQHSNGSGVDMTDGARSISALPRRIGDNSADLGIAPSDGPEGSANGKSVPAQRRVATTRTDPVVSNAADTVIHWTSGRRFTGVFTVTGRSFVRGKPSDDADVIGTLEPGTRVIVYTRAGDYFRVRALDGQQTISGYVHQQDAFFQSSR